MEIKFDATIDDLAEHHFRLFIRSKTYKKNRWVGVAGAFFGVGTVFLFLVNYSKAELPLWFPLLLAGVVAIGYMVFYPDIIKKNIKKYLAKKLINELPCPSTCRIKDRRIVCNLLKKEIAFEIGELVSVAEDERLIELYFGPKGLWVIPKRAFESTNEIDQFKNMLKGE